MANPVEATFTLKSDPVTPVSQSPSSNPALRRSLPIPIPQKYRPIMKPAPYARRGQGHEGTERIPPTPEEEREYFRQIKAAAALADSSSGKVDIEVKVMVGSKSTMQQLPEVKEPSKESELHLDFGVKLKNLFKKFVPKTTKDLDKGQDAVEWQGQGEGQGSVEETGARNKDMAAGTSGETNPKQRKKFTRF